MRRTPLILILMTCVMGWSQPAGSAEDAALVIRIQGRAEAIRGDAQPRPLSPGDQVLDGERVVTADGNSRLELRFADGMDLILGGNTEMTVETFFWQPSQSEGRAELDIRRGAFLVETGKVGKLPGHPLAVKTPVAVIGVRGTRFWGGALDNPLDVLLLDGRITVATPSGSVDLDEAGAGTSVTAAGDVPQPTRFWAEERVRRAFATVGFGN